ncbi:hypothetical protein ACTXT7_011347 [Hymenolepis weldensis]
MASRAVPRRGFRFDRDYYSTHIPKRPIPPVLSFILMLMADKACIHPVQVVGIADPEIQIERPSLEVAMAEIFHRVVHILRLDHKEEEDRSTGIDQALQVLVQVQAPTMEEEAETGEGNY